MKPLSFHGLLTRFLFCVALFSPYWASAQDSLTIASNNSSLTYYRTANHLPLVLQWNVDGQDYWIFPASRDLTFKFRNDHFHTGVHVTNYQIHAQGLFATPGIPVDTSQGQVYAGVVYSVIGSAARSGQSVISEKIHLFNNTKSAITVELVGMGYKASEDEYAGPALTDLAALRNISGSSVAFVDNGYIAVTPYGPLTQFQFNNFKGFNPESSVQRATIGPGQHATMITELKIGY
jgi:hypothetical protein